MAVGGGGGGGGGHPYQLPWPRVDGIATHSATKRGQAGGGVGRGV